MVNKILQKEVRLGSGQGEAPNLAAWLKKRCKDEKLSYRQAAARAGISHATIAAIRKGTRPSAATVVKLAGAFGSDGNNQVDAIFSHQKAVLEDHLLSLCGYRSERTAPVLSEPLARLLDRLNHFDDDQLKAIEQIIDFSVSLGNKSCPVLGEPLARLLDKLSHLNEEKLKLVEAFVDFSATLGNGKRPVETNK